VRKRKLRIQVTPELLQAGAAREAPRIGAYGWRPSPHDLARLRQSTGDPIAYRTLFRGWRKAGFRTQAVKKLAGRGP
jgi:hypothetical protein